MFLPLTLFNALEVILLLSFFPEIFMGYLVKISFITTFQETVGSHLNRNRLHFSVCVYCNRSQMTSQRLKNKKVRHKTKSSGVTVVFYML